MYALPAMDRRQSARLEAHRRETTGETRDFVREDMRKRNLKRRRLRVGILEMAPFAISLELCCFKRAGDIRGGG